MAFLVNKQKLFVGILGLLIAVVCILCFMNKPKRYAVFAGYNKDGVIEPYVVTYLRGLDEVCDGSVYIADSKLKEGEEKKLYGINILYMEHKRHNEYDWGSYKRGYVWLRDNGYLDKADEIVLANDSTYAPITSFKPMFKEMGENKNIGFWGNSFAMYGVPHIQSYFMVFRKEVFNDKGFEEFILSIKHQEEHFDYVRKYEMEFTQYLRGKGYYYKSYLPRVGKVDDEDVLANPSIYPLEYIKKYQNQFIKRKFFLSAEIKNGDLTGELLEYLEKNHKRTYDDIKMSGVIKNI